jgi:hypothetical protein
MDNPPDPNIDASSRDDVMVRRGDYVKLIKAAYENGQRDCRAGINNPPNLGGRKTRKLKKRSKKSQKRKYRK